MCDHNISEKSLSHPHAFPNATMHKADRTSSFSWVFFSIWLLQWDIWSAPSLPFASETAVCGERSFLMMAQLMPWANPLLLLWCFLISFLPPTPSPCFFKPWLAVPAAAVSGFPWQHRGCLVKCTRQWTVGLRLSTNQSAPGLFFMSTLQSSERMDWEREGKSAKIRREREKSGPCGCSLHTLSDRPKLITKPACFSVHSVSDLFSFDRLSRCCVGF